MTPTSTNRPRKHHQDRPNFTAALRRAVWLYGLTERPLAPKDIQAEVQRARQDMGLAPYRGGAVSDYLQRRTRGTELQNKDRQPVHYESVDRKRIPVEAVRQNWRFLEAPDHAQIRLTADQSHLRQVAPGHFHFAGRGSHLPSMTVLVGPIAEVAKLVVEGKFQDRNGLYLLHRNGRNYLGQTKELHTRARSHQATGAEQAFFAFPDESAPVSADVLNVAESYEFRLNPAQCAGLIRLEGGGRSTCSGRWTDRRWGFDCMGIGRNTYHSRSSRSRNCWNSRTPSWAETQSRSP